MRALLLLTACLLAGCASYQSFLEGLESRQMRSCVAWQGGIAAGGGVFGGQGAVRALTVTGGATFEECVKAKNEGLF